jgi:hypothetical protein
MDPTCDQRSQNEYFHIFSGNFSHGKNIFFGFFVSNKHIFFLTDNIKSRIALFHHLFRVRHTLHQQSMKTSLYKISVTCKHVLNPPFLHKGNGNAIRKAPGFVKLFFIERQAFPP